MILSKSIQDRSSVMIFRFIGFLLLFLVASCRSGGNNKEATSGSQQEERKEKVKSSEWISKEAIEAGIRAHIKAKTEEGDGYFHVDHEGDPLRLKLVRVHTEYIARLGPDRHFVCTDLAETNGDVYDVDFFMEGRPGHMEVTRTDVHKINGKPFYTWAQKEDGTWHTVPVEEASSKLMGVIRGEDAFNFHYEVELPELEEEAEIWIPMAQTDTFQQVGVTSLEAPVEYKVLEEKEFGNKILYLELKPEHSHRNITITYRVKRKEKSPYQERGVDPAKYLSATPLIQVGGRFNEIVEKAFRGIGEENRLAQARALYDHVIDSVEYKKAGKYGTGNAQYACEAGKGNCTEFHSYFISLARTAGIPARFAIGAVIPSARDEGGVNGYHCWAEFYAQGKWWPVDISEGNKYSALATYYFGHHPANRIQFSEGRDLEPAPGPETGNIPFHGYPVLEVGGFPAQPETRFSFQRISGKKEGAGA